jgi:hypothetical protein
VQPASVVGAVNAQLWAAGAHCAWTASVKTQCCECRHVAAVGLDTPVHDAGATAEAQVRMSSRRASATSDAVASNGRSRVFAPRKLSRKVPPRLFPACTVVLATAAPMPVRYDVALS